MEVSQQFAFNLITFGFQIFHLKIVNLVFGFLSIKDHTIHIVNSKSKYFIKKKKPETTKPTI